MSSSGSSYLLSSKNTGDPQLTKRKKIYLADSIDELVMQAEKWDFDAKSTPTEAIIQLLEEMFEEGTELLKESDEEKAFITFFRYSSLFFIVRNTIQDERQLKRIRIRANTAVKKCEALKESLTRRYHASDSDQVSKPTTSTGQPLPIEEDKPNECQICFEREVNCVLIACGHQRTCLECAQALVQRGGVCPFCR